MSNPDEQRTSFIPPNFIEKGKILNGTDRKSTRLNSSHD